MKLSLLVSTIVLFSTTLSQAADKACLTGAPEDQLTCVTAEFSKSEAALNKTYNFVLSTLSEKTEFGNEKNFLLENMRSRLRISQRSWVYFRESQCEMEAFGLMDTQHVTATHVACQTLMNNQRTVVLQNYFKQFLVTLMNP